MTSIRVFRVGICPFASTFFLPSTFLSSSLHFSQTYCPEQRQGFCTQLVRTDLPKLSQKIVKLWDQEIEREKKHKSISSEDIILPFPYQTTISDDGDNLLISWIRFAYKLEVKISVAQQSEELEDFLDTLQEASLEYQRQKAGLKPKDPNDPPVDEMEGLIFFEISISDIKRPHIPKTDVGCCVSKLHNLMIKDVSFLKSDQEQVVNAEDISPALYSHLNEFLLSLGFDSIFCEFLRNYRDQYRLTRLKHDVQKIKDFFEP